MVSSNIIFGTGVIPVKITNLHKSDTSKTCQISPCCKSRTGLKTICKVCEEVLQKKDLLKGLPINKTESHIFTQEQDKALKDFDKVIEVIGKIPKSEIDYTKICGSYLVVPDKQQVKMFKKTYKVFERGLAESDHAIVVKFAPSTKQKIGILTSSNNVMVILQIVYEENFNQISEIPEITVSQKEIKQGIGFVEKLELTNISELVDEYKEKLYALVEKDEPLTVTIPEAKQEEEELSFFK